ncbi:hypothetical protein J2Y69_001667 [Microbacterium resistens]|uniref:DUF998 domain-containing protein n=1 Tax=Microbacterium resistens TaxID=156977 RepID=A0ABU1SDV3_9MICO|nr:DUF998 domain-containing protein [Microbacterium resistens]MDR6867068.1 hypothetical protein [Microbacterium resistens]
MPRARCETVASVLLLIAALLYLGLPYEAAAGFPLDPARSYLSELAAEDQPLSLSFRLADGAAGLLAAIAAILLIATHPRWPGRTVAAAVAVFGLGTLADVVFPMACATSASAACARADAAGALGLSHQIHTVTSVVALTAVVVSAIVLVLLVWSTPPRPSALGVVLAIGTVLLIASTVAISVIALASAADGTLPAGAGYVQRVQTLLIAAYLAALVPVSRAIRRHHTPQHPATQPPAAQRPATQPPATPQDAISHSTVLQDTIRRRPESAG